MKSMSLINTLLRLRLTYYKGCIFERLRRFKFLIIFMVAMITPTVAFLVQVIQTASIRLIDGPPHLTYGVSLIIFQLIAMIWVGSQYDCLKIADFEDYLRTLKIPNVHFFIIEIVFCAIINLPFLIFLIIGVYSLIAQHQLLLGIAHFLYLYTSLLFLSICLIYSRAIPITSLVITNILFIFLNGLLGSILLALMLILGSYHIVANKPMLPFTISHYIYTPKLHLSRFCPNIYLNLKSLWVGNKVYTACIVGMNALSLFILICYLLAKSRYSPNSMSFLITLNTMMFFCSLLIYKLVETRKAYGVYFSIFYTKLTIFCFDLLAIYIIALSHFVIMLLIGCYFGFNTILMFKALIIATASIIIFTLINRYFSFYGPIIALLALVCILVVSRGFYSAVIY